MKQKEEQVYERYIGVDGHKDYVVIGGINAQLEQALQQRRMSLVGAWLGILEGERPSAASLFSSWREDWCPDAQIPNNGNRFTNAKNRYILNKSM